MRLGSPTRVVLRIEKKKHDTSKPALHRIWALQTLNITPAERRRDVTQREPQ
jgi:hypothetical protein